MGSLLYPVASEKHSGQDLASTWGLAPAQLFLTNSDFRLMAPNPSILQSML